MYVSSYEALIAVSDMLTINRNTTDVPKMLVKVKEALLGLPLTGFCGVKQSFLREHNVWSEKTQSEQSVFGIETIGINLAALTLLPHVDMTQTLCTNTQTIYQMYGIEATMNMLHRDFVEVLGDGNVHARARNVVRLTVRVFDTDRIGGIDASKCARAPVITTVVNRNRMIIHRKSAHRYK